MKVYISVDIEGVAGVYHPEQTRAGNVGDDRHAWHALLDKALAQGRFQLFFQPVVAADEPARVLHHKVLARVIDEQGGLIPAGRFLPWVERFGWAARRIFRPICAPI